MVRVAHTRVSGLSVSVVFTIFLYSIAESLTAVSGPSLGVSLSPASTTTTNTTGEQCDTSLTFEVRKTILSLSLLCRWPTYFTTVTPSWNS